MMDLAPSIVAAGATVTNPACGLGPVAIGTRCTFAKAGSACHPVTCENNPVAGVRWDLPVTVCYTNGCSLGDLDQTAVTAAGGTSIETFCSHDTISQENGRCTFVLAGHKCDISVCSAGTWTIPVVNCLVETASCLVNAATADTPGALADGWPILQSSKVLSVGQTLEMKRFASVCSTITCNAPGVWSGVSVCPVLAGTCDATALQMSPYNNFPGADVESPNCPMASNNPIADGTVCTFRMIATSSFPGLKCETVACNGGAWERAVSCGCLSSDVVQITLPSAAAVGTVQPERDHTSVGSPLFVYPETGACTSLVCTAIGWTPTANTVCTAPSCSVTAVNFLGFTSDGTPSAGTCVTGGTVVPTTVCEVIPSDNTLFGLLPTDTVICDRLTCKTDNDWDPLVPRCSKDTLACKFDQISAPATPVLTYEGNGCAEGYIVMKDDMCTPTVAASPTTVCHTPTCQGSDVFDPAIVCYVDGCAANDLLQALPADTTANDAITIANHALDKGAVSEFKNNNAALTCTSHTCDTGAFTPPVVKCILGCAFNDAAALVGADVPSGTDCEQGNVVAKDSLCEIKDMGGTLLRVIKCSDATGPLIWEVVNVCQTADLTTGGASTVCTPQVEENTLCAFTLANHVCTTVTCGAGGWDVTTVVCTLQCDTTAAGLAAAQTFDTCTGLVDEGTKCTVTQGADPCTGEVICTGVSMAPTWDASTLVCKECKYDDLTLNGAVATDAMKCAPGKTVAEADVCQFTISGGAQMCRDVTCTNFAWDVTTVDCNVDECTTAGMACVMCTDPSQLLPDDWVCSCPNGITVTAAVPDCSQCSYDSLSVPAGAAPSDPNCAAGKLLTDTATCPFTKAGAVCTTATCTSGAWDTTMPTCADTDECVANSPTCGALATCNDPTPMVAPAGDWVCTCANGFAATAAAPTAAECAKCSFDAVVVPAGSMPSDVKCDTGKYIDTADTCEFTKANEICSPVTCTSGAWDTTMPTCEPNPDECVANSPTCGALATCNDPTPMVAPAGDWVCTCTANGFAVTAAAPTAADCSQCDYSTLLRAPGATPKDTAKCDTGKMITNRDSCEFEKVGEQCDTAFCNNGAWTQNLKCTSLDECLGAGAACPGTCKDDNLQSLNDWTCTCPNGVIAVASFPDCNQCQYDRLLFAPGASPQDTATCDTGKIVPNGGACAFKKDGAACTTATCAGGSWSSTVVCTDVNTAPSVTCTTGTPPCAVDVNEDSSALPATGTADVRHVATGVLTVSASTPAGLASETAQTVGAVCECGVGCTATVNTASGEVAVVVGPDVSGVKTVECTVTDDGTPQESSGKIAVAVVTILPVNDPPSGVVLTTQMKVAVLETVATVTEENWVTGVQPGPATAVDETAQVVTATCTGSDTAFDAIPALSFRDKEADLTFLLKGPAGLYPVACTLDDGAGGTLLLPRVMVDIKKAAMTTPSGQETALLTSEVVSNEGSTLSFDLDGIDYVKAGPVAFLVIGPDGTAIKFGDGEPLITMRTDKNIEDVKAGILKTASENSNFITAEVSPDKRGLNIRLQDPSFLIVAPDTEAFSVQLSPALFDVANGKEVCKAGGCQYGGTVLGEVPEYPNHDELDATHDAANSVLLASSLIVAAGTASGTKSGMLAMTSRALLCPGQGPDKLDRTLNPLGLRLGRHSYREYNGAVIGSIIMNATLLLLCGLGAWYINHLVLKRRAINTVLEHHTNMAAHVGKHYVLRKARFGWLLVPFSFLYGGAVVGAVTALIYSEVVFKIIGIFLCITFILAFPYYAWRQTKMSKEYAYIADIEPEEGSTELTWKVRLFWGTQEWVASDAPKAYSWLALHHLVFDGYTRRWRYFLTIELFTMCLLAIFTAWQPATRDSCWARAIMMTITLLTYTLLLICVRPYLAMYENVMESLIALTEAVMMVATCVAMGSDDPAGHWGSAVGGRLGVVAVYLIVVKFFLDSTIFVIDEYGEWTATGGSGSKMEFFLYWFCFIGASKDVSREMHRGMPEEKDIPALEELTIIKEPEDVAHPYHRPEGLIDDATSRSGRSQGSIYAATLEGETPSVNYEFEDDSAFPPLGATGRGSMLLPQRRYVVEKAQSGAHILHQNAKFSTIFLVWKKKVFCAVLV